MYRKNDNQEILDALDALRSRMDAMEAQLNKAGADAAEEGGPQEKAPAPAAPQAQRSGERTLLWDMTEAQYELSQELTDGIAKLKRIIAEGERSAVEAKGKYRK